MNSDFFERLNDWIRDTESSIVNFLSAFAPWLAPIIPAYMTYQHAQVTLNFPEPVAVAAALVVEILGFTAVSTYLAFWFHNRKNVAESKKAPVELVIIAFGFYLALIVFSNVLLDSFPEDRWAEVAVRALFTLQTIPAAMLVSVRTQHRDLLREISRERQQKLSGSFRNNDGQGESSTKVSENFPKDWRTLRPRLNYQQVEGIANLSPAEVRALASKYGVTEKTIQNWRVYARTELRLN
jgi:hypothetical protein